MPRRAFRRPRSDHAFEAWLIKVVERTDPFMAWLGVVFALLIGFQIAVDVEPGVGLAINVASWTIWAVFWVDFLVKLALAPAKVRFLRRHWLEMLVLVVPTLRVLSFLRLFRLGRALPAARAAATSHRTASTARRLLRSRIAYLTGLATVSAIGLAELAYIFERDRTLPTFPDALTWSAAVVIGIQGDPVPATLPGRIVMIVGFAVGVILVASLAGSFGSFLLQDRDDRRVDRDRSDGDPAG
jgi:voltage-gated potassium channel